jgi:hypothetical protein
MISRMRKSRRFKCRTLLFFVFVGFLVNLVVTYACWIRAGFIEFGYDSKYWQVDHVDVFGYRQIGYRFGVHGWANSISTFEPNQLSFSYHALLDDDVVDRDTTIVNTLEFGASFGWPFFCVSNSEITRNTKSITAGMNFATVDTIKGTTVDITPQPKWYFGGVRTGINNWPYFSIPVAVQLRYLVANVVIYSVFLFETRRLWNYLRAGRRKRRGLCLACGYAVEEFEVCPECGTERACDHG